MSNIDKHALRWKAEKATQGEWWSDSCGNEGTYGSGDDCAECYTSYAVYDENNQILLDTLNSTAACINEEYDGECHVAWDEVGQRNAEFIAAANPATVLALLDELEAKGRRLNEILKPDALLPVIDDMDEDNLRHVIKTVCENYSLLHAKWESAGNRAKAAEKRIAELEGREVKLPKPISVLHRRDFIDAHRSIYAYPEAEVNAALAYAGINIAAAGKGE